MSLHIIIDGYNFIRRSDCLSVLDNLDLQYGREGLLESLGTYNQKKPHRITVVFDAANEPNTMERKNYRNGIEIRFSPRGESADTVIKNMVRQEREKALVVSSDREVTDYCSSQGAAVLSSSAFERKISQVDMCGFDDGDIEENDGWTPTTKKKGPKKKLSKKKRKNQVKINKL